MMPLRISAMMAPFSIICGALRGSSAQTFCSTDSVWPVAITIITSALAAWRNALYVRGVICLCGSGVRSVPSRSIASRRYMSDSWVDNAVNVELSLLYPSISGLLRGLQEYRADSVFSQPCQMYQAVIRNLDFYRQAIITRFGSWFSQGSFTSRFLKARAALSPGVSSRVTHGTPILGKRGSDKGRSLMNL